MGTGWDLLLQTLIFLDDLVNGHFLGVAVHLTNQFHMGLEEQTQQEKQVLVDFGHAKIHRFHVE